MLVIKRKQDQKVDVVHWSGDELRIAFRVTEGSPPQVEFAFDDDARKFAIHRTEKRAAKQADAG